MKLKTPIITLILLTFLNCINDKGLIRELPPISETEYKYDLSNALNIYIDGKNQLYVNNEKFDESDLKVKIREYESKNKSESVISLKYERDTAYETYINTQNTIVSEIRNLRIKLSKEKYNKKLDSLNNEELTAIRKVYPLNLIE